jgi:hypothetical protein
MSEKKPFVSQLQFDQFHDDLYESCLEFFNQHFMDIYSNLEDSQKFYDELESELDSLCKKLKHLNSLNKSQFLNDLDSSVLRKYDSEIQNVD